MSDNNSSGGGCGCVGLILLTVLFWTLFFGLQTPWGKLNLDVFPPRVWKMEEAK